MARVPKVTHSFEDGALGIIASLSEYHYKIGHSTKGETNRAYIFADPKKVVETLGSGQLVEAVCEAIETSRKPVIAIPVESDAGELSTIEKTGSGPDIEDDASEPHDAYALRLRITREGALGTAAFEYSLDGGESWSPEMATVEPASPATAFKFEIPGSGIQLSFPTGPYEEGTLYKANSTAPSYGLDDAMEAIEAALEGEEKFRLIHLVGQAVKSGAITAPEASAAMAVAIGARLQAAEANDIHAYAVLEAPEAEDDELKEAFKGVSSVRVGVAAGFCELYSPVTRRFANRSSAWPIVSRIMANPIHRHPARVRDGALSGVRRTHRDERTEPGLLGARFMCLMTHRGRPGVYVAGAPLMAPPGSDYRNIMNRQVADATADIVIAGLQLYLADDVRVNRKTGFILEKDAQDIEQNILAAIETAIIKPGHGSGAEFELARDDNILATEEIHYRWGIIPVGYMTRITGSGGFRNPARNREAG